MAARRAKYSRLPPDTAAIRMLAILPSMKKATPVKAVLAGTDLDNLDEAPFAFYEALSYTWGDPSLPRVPCKLNGYEHLITRNLETALKRLRGRTRKRWLWVDALCINQDDLQERAQQVQMMRRIYENAEQVIVWLGPEADDSAGAIRTLEHFTDADCEDDIAESLADDMELQRWLAVAKFFDREWFRRVWVRQEIAVTKEAKVMAGRDFIRWDTLSLAADTLTSPDNTTDFDLIVRRISNRSSGAHWVRAIEMFREAYAERQGHDLEVLLLHARGADVTDPRDRVYGLLGLSLVRERFKVDYSLATAEVFTQAMKILIEHKNDLDSLSGCSLSARSMPTLPSWVLDLNADFDAMVLRAREGGEALYRASGGETADFSISLTPPILRVKGYVVDTVREVVGSFYFNEAKYSNDKGAHVGRWLEEAQKAMRKRHPGMSDIDVMNNFCRMLVADTNDRGDRADNGLWSHVLENQSLKSLPGKLRSVFEQEGPGFAARMADICWARVMLSTDSGRIGITDAACAKGDLVCVLYGAGVPFVLRRQGDTYLLVGEAYVQGITDGEAVDEAKANGRAPTDFLIS